MANIKTYTDQIAEAVYGEEVRSSIINALKKVNDDNESYTALKAEVQADHDEVQAWVEDMDNITAAANAAKTQLTSATTLANSTLSDLVQTRALARETNTTLDATVTAAQTKKEELQAVIDSAGSGSGGALSVPIIDISEDSPAYSGADYCYHTCTDEQKQTLLASINKGFMPVIYSSGYYSPAISVTLSDACGRPNLCIYYFGYVGCGTLYQKYVIISNIYSEA